MYEDKTLICKDCGKEFIFTAGEQEFYAEKGFENEPVRCKECRAAKKAAIKASRVMHDAVCANCGLNAKYRLSPRTTALFTAANALQNFRRKVRSKRKFQQKVSDNFGNLLFILF